MAESLITAYDILSEDSRVRAIVLTSADIGNRFFCAGLDFNATHGRSPDMASYRDVGGRVSLAMRRCVKPINIGINGSAVGVGMTMTLPATIRVASREAKCGFVFSRRGLCMEACSSFYLPRLDGASKAMHLLSTGAVYPATHRLYDGLFSEVTAPEDVLPTALELASDIAANVSNTAVHIMKEMVYRGPSTPEEAHLLESRLIFGLTSPGGDSAEGMESFLEKRVPNFPAAIGNNALAGYPWWTTLDVRAKI